MSPFSLRRNRPKEIEQIDLRTATPEERRYALARINGASKQRARKLAEHPELAEIGAEKRQNVRVEESFYPAWERLIRLHDCDCWHCGSSQRSQPGFPDYVIWGEGWEAWVELKARQVSGRLGTLSVHQKRYKASIERADREYVVFLFPDEWHKAELWLFEKTGRPIWSVKPPEPISERRVKVDSSPAISNRVT